MEQNRRRGPSAVESTLAGDAPADLRRTDFCVSGEHYIVLSYPSSPEDALLSLSRVESAVARAAAAGLTNAEIAINRGCSRSTVQNQMASVYRKLNVSSRAALAALLADLEDHQA